MDVNSVVEKVKELVKKGNVSRVVVRKDGKEQLNIPVNVGLLGGVLAPKLLLLAGVLATVGFGCVVEIIKTDGQVMNVVTEESAQKVRDMASNVVEQVKSVIDPAKSEEADFEQTVDASAAGAVPVWEDYAVENPFIG